jgi:hypothetical protein
MTGQLMLLTGTPKRAGIAADHGGYAVSDCPVRMLREAGADYSPCTPTDPAPDTQMISLDNQSCGERKKSATMS